MLLTCGNTLHFPQTSLPLSLLIHFVVQATRLCSRKCYFHAWILDRRFNCLFSQPSFRLHTLPFRTLPTLDRYSLQIPISHNTHSCFHPWLIRVSDQLYRLMSLRYLRSLRYGVLSPTFNSQQQNHNHLTLIKEKLEVGFPICRFSD